ncbi:hypothetical protein B0H11DRAFT_2213403 [Mycena galericulata]|nr:hypothetical protein B0H11DRAFT_2213403 [Mycena galericulata]
MSTSAGPLDIVPVPSMQCTRRRISIHESQRATGYPPMRSALERRLSIFVGSCAFGVQSFFAFVHACDRFILASTVQCKPRVHAIRRGKFAHWVVEVEVIKDGVVRQQFVDDAISIYIRYKNIIDDPHAERGVYKGIHALRGTYRIFHNADNHCIDLATGQEAEWKTIDSGRKPNTTRTAQLVCVLSTQSRFLSSHDTVELPSAMLSSWHVFLPVLPGF